MLNRNEVPMNGQVEVFNFSQEKTPIRVQLINSEPWFVAKDVCEVLEHSNHKMAVKTLDEDEVSSVYLIDAIGRKQKTKIVSESGLYSLIFQSRKPEAKKFRKWVTEEVLPTIRKTGGYIPTTEEETTEEFLARAMRVTQEILNRKEQKIKELEKQKNQQFLQIEAEKPKVIFAEAVATSQRSCLVSELAKILKQNGIEIGQNKLFSWLREKGYLGNKGEYYNMPTQRAMNLELFEIKQTSISKPDGSILVSTTPKVTGKGQIYFVNKFLNASEKQHHGRD